MKRIHKPGSRAAAAVVLMWLLLAQVAKPGITAALATETGAATISPALRVGGASGYGDAHNADIYPAVAFEKVSNRYLVVWLTARNANFPTIGLDVYGVFLNNNGERVGNEFRISDDNNVILSSQPMVVAGENEFAVSWTAGGGNCRILVQRVTDNSAKTDQVLQSGSGHRHSPSLAYDEGREKYLMAFVEGDDYLPPTLFGAPTASCGDNAASSSRVKAFDFHFEAETPVVGSSLTVSSSGGSFRPRVAYNANDDQYLAVWEDRRNISGQAYRFDVYAQRMGGNLVSSGGNFALATGGDYTNYDTSATWTPRPAVSAGKDGFLAAWFSRTSGEGAVTWSVKGKLVPEGAPPAATPITLAQMTFAASHAGTSPTAFMGLAYSWGAEEYLMGMTSYLESLWGYLSFALIQRVDQNGQPLKLDGTAQSQPGTGYAIDFETEDQISTGVAVNPVGGRQRSDFMLVYSKHLQSQPENDIDIWRVVVRLATPEMSVIYLPVGMKE